MVQLTENCARILSCEKMYCFINSDKANKVTQEWNVAIVGCRTCCTYMQPNTTLHIHLMQMSFEHFICLSAQLMDILVTVMQHDESLCKQNMKIRQ